MKWMYYVLAIGLFFSCQEDDKAIHNAPNFMEVPNGFDAIEHPEGNHFTQARWDLGKKLFFDPIMSFDSTISCATCHKPELAFSDDVAFSPGVEDRPGTRNTPSIANVTYHPYFTREGGIPTLEMQVQVPIQEHNEFDFNIVLLAERLANDPEYVAMSELAYDRHPDAFTITRSLACFERSLISGYSPYDQYFNYNDDDALSEAQVRGMDLFFGDKTNCSTCHSGFNFTSYDFANNGLYEQYSDSGRFRLTGLESDRALFKIPSLRNIALTPPYMHDGSLSNLEDIVRHYNVGGKANSQKSELIKPLHLSENDINDLVSFLEALTDESFVNNPLFKN